MSYPSLLFMSATQGLTDVSATNRDNEHEIRVSGDSAEGWSSEVGSRAGNDGLPSGIVSLDHWLDLNA